MSGFLKALFCTVVSLTAPVVCIFYRKGWFLTPDDTTSPYGQYEPAMRKIYARFGTKFGDWWWLGMRNQAYGLAYDLKPDHFKNLTSYANCQVRIFDGGAYRRIDVDGFTERAWFFGFFHVIVGYRLRPIADEWKRGWKSGEKIPCRPINMDARPILSIRGGGKDD